MDEKKIYDVLEGCRPGQLESDCSEFRAVREELLEDEVLQLQFEKSQAFDQCLTEEFLDVPVADDVRDRLQEAIDEAVGRPELDIDACCESLGPASDQAVQLAGDEEKPSGRLGRTIGWLVVVASLLTAVVIWQQFRNDEPVSPESLAGQAENWTKQVWSDQHEWNYDLQQLPSNYPVADDVLPPVQRWSSLETEIDRRAVVYDLSSKKTGRLLLFVFRTRQSYQLPQFALKELMGSGRNAVAAWQKDDLLYVMVGRRDGQPRLREFIKRRPLAKMWRPTDPAA